MARNAGVIEVNGHRYDAATGQLIGAVKSAVTAIKPGGGQVMDGFMRRPAPRPQTRAAKPNRSHLRTAAQTVHRRAQNSKTIMRDVVSRPKLKTKPQATTGSRLSRASNSVISSKRAFRAKTILKSPRINRFSMQKAQSQPEQSTHEGEVITTASKSQPVQATRALAKPLPSMITSVSHTQLERMLDHALARADAHKQATKTRAHRSGPLGRLRRLPRWFSAGLFLVLFFAVGGFFAWQNVPQLSLKVASSRAHIDASVPSYMPYGFSLAGPVKYEGGSVTTELTTPADKNKKLTVKQQPSKLNSESLAESEIPANVPVQTSQVKGTTVYIYGKDNDATWVNKGIKYTVKNKAQLSSDELLKIAGGL